MLGFAAALELRTPASRRRHVCLAVVIGVAPGWYGPRYIGAAIPFFFLGLGQVWIQASRWVRWLLGLLVGAGGVITAMAVSTLTMVPEDVGSPLTQVILPSFLNANFAENRQSFLQYGDADAAAGLLGAWNWGQLLGLSGHWSLLPLLAIWAVAAYLLMVPLREFSPPVPKR